MNEASMLKNVSGRAKFWTRRALTVFAIMLASLTVVELLKGHELLAGVQFALTWSAISTIIFMGTRMYYVSRGKNCPLCNDLPQEVPTERRRSPAVED